MTSEIKKKSHSVGGKKVTLHLWIVNPRKLSQPALPGRKEHLSTASVHISHINAVPSVCVRTQEGREPWSGV